MGKTLSEVFEETKTLSADDRALLAHCLISGLEAPADENADAEWIALTQKRIEAVESGRVQTCSWGEIKQKLYAGR